MSESLEHYELLFIVPGSTDAKEVPAIKDKVAALISKSEGKITLDKDWEERKFAYKIKQETRGHYWLIEFDADKDKVKDLSHQIKLMPEILRFVLVKAKVKTAADLAEEEKVKAKIMAKKAEVVKQELKDEEVKKEEEKKVEIKKEEEKTEGKVSMEDLDKKLDELLSDDLDV